MREELAASFLFVSSFIAFNIDLDLDLNWLGHEKTSFVSHNRIVSKGTCLS